MCVCVCVWIGVVSIITFLICKIFLLLFCLLSFPWSPNLIQLHKLLFLYDIFTFIEIRFLQLHCNISISFLIFAIILICKNNEKAQLVQLQLKQLHKRFSSNRRFTSHTPLPWFMLNHQQFSPLLILHHDYLTTRSIHLFCETTVFCNSVPWNAFGKSCVKEPY